MEFADICKIDVNEKTEKRKGDNGKDLTYLSWAWAWAEFKKICPDATYEIKKFGNDLPYVYDYNTGYMVFTTVTAGGITHEMWLPVMNQSNRAMKSEPYEYTTKYGTKTVEAADMFAVNKTIMRCLVKNLAMFGLGLYIYAGEDLPEPEENGQSKTKTAAKPAEKPAGFATSAQKEEIKVLLGGAKYAKLMNACGGKLTLAKYEDLKNGTTNL